MGLHRSVDRGEQVQPSGAPPRLKVTRGADGGLRVKGPDDVDHDELRGSVEAAERPPVPDDPRSGPLRDVPPVGGV
jgi:hypothetical protein